MSKSKPTRRLSTAQIVFYILSALLVLAMILSAFINT
jgi:predicted nucleic acid-binding Zn ribbon protein